MLRLLILNSEISTTINYHHSCHIQGCNLQIVTLEASLSFLTGYFLLGLIRVRGTRIKYCMYRVNHMQKKSSHNDIKTMTFILVWFNLRFFSLQITFVTAIIKSTLKILHSYFSYFNLKSSVNGKLF